MYGSIWKFAICYFLYLVSHKFSLKSAGKEGFLTFQPSEGTYVRKIMILTDLIVYSFPIDLYIRRSFIAKVGR